MRTFQLTDAVHGIAFGEPETTSVYVVNDLQPTIIDTGKSADAAELLTGIDEVGVDPSTVDTAIVSHVHLDHAGGTAALADAASNLTVVVHGSTASFLTDAEKHDRLVESTKRAMGGTFSKIGASSVLSSDTVRPVKDGDTIDTGKGELRLLSTPGHSFDHLSVWWPVDGTLFLNESIGSYYPRADVWVPPATVPGFDPDKARESISTQRDLTPERVALSHVGARENPETVFETAKRRLEEFDRQVPELYHEHDGNLKATRAAVRRELVGLDGSYDEATVATEASVQTRGFLSAHDLI